MATSLILMKPLKASARPLRASQTAKVSIKSACVAMGGLGLDEIRSTAEITLTPSGGIVMEREISRALRESEKKASQKLTNRKVIHTIPLQYRVDGVKVLGNPDGLQGTRLAVDTLLVTMLAQHYDNLVEAVESAGVEVEGVMASPLAASLVTFQSAKNGGGGFGEHRSGNTFHRGLRQRHPDFG